MTKPAINLTMDMETRGDLRRMLSVAQTIPAAKKAFKRHAQRFAATVRDDMRQHAPKRKGVLRKAIKSRSTSSGGALVYVDKGKARHHFIVEEGTQDRKTKKGYARGKSPAQPYLEPARKRARARFRQEITDKVRAELFGILSSTAKGVSK